MSPCQYYIYPHATPAPRASMCMSARHLAYTRPLCLHLPGLPTPSLRTPTLRTYTPTLRTHITTIVDLPLCLVWFLQPYKATQSCVPLKCGFVFVFTRTRTYPHAFGAANYERADAPHGSGPQVRRYVRKNSRYVRKNWQLSSN